MIIQSELNKKSIIMPYNIYQQRAIARGMGYNNREINEMEETQAYCGFMVLTLVGIIYIFASFA
jgi:hypothetical protein